jgi:hypothetical protein
MAGGSSSGSALTRSLPVGMRYPSDAHCPRSINLHRWEQNGRYGLDGCQTVLDRQVGQVMGFESVFSPAIRDCKRSVRS